MRRLLALALPVIVVQLGIVSQGLVDTAMVGRLSAEQLAAVALGNLYFFGVTVFGMGLLLALDPLVSQAFGAGDDKGVELAVQRGLVLSAGLSIVVSALLALAEPVLSALRQPPEVAPVAAAYAQSLIAGMLPFYGFLVFRQSMQALGRVAPIVWTVILANGLNAAANWLLVFGNWGLPALGAVGSGWATSVSRWFMCLGVLVLGRDVLASRLRRWRRGAMSWRPLVGMFRLGAPIGGHMVLEFGAFGAIGVFMGWLGAEAMAGHQVAVNLAAFAFMVPVGIAQAATALVGKSVGEGEPPLARRFVGASLLACCAAMTVTAALFAGFPEAISSQFTGAEGVVAVAAALLPVAACFQMFDGLQVVCAGLLRGVADTVRPLLYNILGFWLLGMPVSLWCGFRAGMGPTGLWVGLAVGLGVAAVLLLGRTWKRFRRPLERFSLSRPRP